MYWSFSKKINRFESALQQNFIFDSFENDWTLLGNEMASIGGPGEINLKVNQFNFYNFYFVNKNNNTTTKRNINHLVILIIVKIK